MSIFDETKKRYAQKKFPLKRLSRKKAKDKPWMNKDLHEMRKIRDENRRKVNEGKLDTRTYKTHRNLTRKKNERSRKRILHEYF